MPSIHDAQDGDGENPQRAPNGVQVLSDDPTGESQPEVQQPAQAVHQQNSDRIFFGISQHGPQVRGNDPFDYEQRFPEDKRLEELGPLARVWRTYLEECGTFDLEMLEGWRDGLDVLLVFAGLFSAVVTTFVVQTSQNLQVDYGQVTATLLFELIDVQRAAANGSLVNNVPRSDLTPFSNFHPTTSDSLINGLWFTSLSFSLATALFAVLTKQWIHQYIAVPSGTPRDRCRVRQFRYMGLQQWGVGFIIGLLPVLLSVSLGIFLVGLVLFLTPLQVTIASVVGTITFISFAAYFITNFLPIIYPSCPYKTPLSQYIFPLYTYIAHNGFFFSGISSLEPEPPIRTIRDAERSTVESSADDMDTYALAWLFNMSSNPSVQTIVVQSIGALPLASIKSIKQHAKGVSELCNTLTHSLLYPIAESRFDCLTRASFCLSTAPPTFSADLRKRSKEQLSPEVYAELLASDHHDFSSETQKMIHNLVEAQFMPSADYTRIHLQPIVWGRLFWMLLPFSNLDDSLIQPLFRAIPSYYWLADYKPLPLFSGRNTLDICLTPNRDDHGVPSLEEAINKYLYPSIADAIIWCFRDEYTVFHPDPTDDFPTPQDPRLCALLTMAGSPSAQTVAMSNSLHDSFFGMVVSNIGTFMDVCGFHLHDDKIPSLTLDANRYAVLKLLYTLISSDVLDGTSMRSLDQRITLVTFFRVLNSTSPCPRFLLEDWCTPVMASNFVRIAFQDQTWTIREYYGQTRHLLESDELILFFSRFAPTANLIFPHFVSGCHLDKIGKLRSYDLLANECLHVILDTFITRITPDVLNHEIFQRSISYIFEPENLFTICAVHISRRDTHSLRRLAQVRPDHPAWPECLRKLENVAEHFDFSDFSDLFGIPSAVSDFRQFVKGGCVGNYGLDTPDLLPQQVRVEDKPLMNKQSLMKWLPRLSHWLRRHCDTRAGTEEIMMTSSSSVQV